MTARRPTIAVLCVLLVASAGCSGLVDSGNSPATDAPTTAGPTTDATSAPTNGPTTTQPEQLAPGITSEGVTDALALANAHRAALRESAFVREATTEWENKTAASVSRTTAQVTNNSHWRIRSAGVRTFGAQNATYAQYADGERVLWRLDDGENVSYGMRSVDIEDGVAPIPPAQVFPPSVYDRGLVYSLFGGANTTVEGVDNGDVVVTGSATEMVVGSQTVTDVEFTATVSSEGLVQSLELSYESDGTLIERSVTYTTDVTDPVEQPDWYETALNRTAAGNAAATE